MKRILATGTNPWTGNPGAYVQAPYNPADLPLLRAFPGARWDGQRKVRWVSVDPSDREQVLSIAKRLRLEVSPDLSAQVKLQDSPEIEDAVSRAVKAGLYDFQVEGVRWLAGRNRGLLGDEMGTGKTVQSLVAIPAGSPVLVISPACVKFNWENEANRWRPDFKTAVLTGRKNFRFPVSGEIVIVNYDILPSKLDKSDVPSGLVTICDEVHLTKNHKALRTKRTRAIVAASKVAWTLTGTPLLNKPFDLWGVLGTSQLERKVFGGWNGFLRAFNAYKSRWGGYEFGAVDPSVPDLLKRAILRRRRDEVLTDLPRKVRQNVVVNGLSAGLRRDLDSAWKGWENTDELPPFEKFSKIRARLAESRIPALLEMVSSYEEQDTPVVVFSAHRAPIDTLGDRDGWDAITGSTPAHLRSEIVDRFQAGKLKGLALTIAAGGVGLTLTRAHHEIFVDLDWVPANVLQAEDRCVRIGATADSVHIVRLISNHELDQHIVKLLAQKTALIEAAIDGPGLVRDEARAVEFKAEQDREDKLRDARRAEFQAEQDRRDARRIEWAAKNAPIDFNNPDDFITVSTSDEVPF